MAVQIAIAVVRDGGKYLIGRRPAGVPLAGLWEFPGGKVRAGESPREAAARECWEETSLAVQVGQRLRTINHAYEHGILEIHFFACAPASPEQRPAPPFQWVDALRLGDYDFPAANGEIVAAIIAEAKQDPTRSSRQPD